MKNRIYLTENNIPDNSIKNKLIFDTNVWLSIYGITANNTNQQTRIYSNFYKKALENKSKIYLLGTIASEYINRSIKMRYYADNTVNESLKIHQQAMYPQWIETISDEVSYLVNDCERLDDGFSLSNPEEMCRSCIGKEIDYNDLIISEVCKNNNISLVTDDKDFSCEEIEIITRNRKLF